MYHIKSALTYIIATSILIALPACDGEAEQAANKEPEKTQTDTGQVVAKVNGHEITIHELNDELARLNTQSIDKELLKRSMLKSLIIKKAFAQNAVEAKLDRTPIVMREMKRSNDAILARAWLNSQSIHEPQVTRSEADAYIENTPHLFADRHYFIFDTIVVPSDYMTQERRQAWDDMTDLNAIERALAAENIENIRKPYAVYSEGLPMQVINDMDNIRLKGDIFYIIKDDVTYISLYKSSRPAILTGEEARKVAIKLLSSHRTKQFLNRQEIEALQGADIQYLGAFADMNDLAPVSDENSNELPEGEAHSTPEVTSEEKKNENPDKPGF